MTDTAIAQQVLQEARAWIGTPYVHQASVKHAGCDCLGLVRGVWRGVLGEEPEEAPAYTADWSEISGQEALWAAARRNLLVKPTRVPALGDVILFRMRDGAMAKHLGIQSCIGETPAFIHAFGGHAVVESPLSAPWARRVVARFSYPIQSVEEAS
ncbi:MAG: C40 family peptidase [Cognatishimia sp.]|uniref:NlpC/P60 family protein n=1 Tax=Cognatishimia sp. TaxID=2211648 RepID=UPI003B8AA2AB